MKIKVLDELSEKRDLSVENTKKIMDNLVGDAKTLLLEANSQERQLLRAAGLDHQFRKIEKEQGINLERTTFENTYGEKVFTLSEIKNICIKYNLKFLKSEKFSGNVDPLLGAKMKRFFEKANIDGSNYAAGSDLFIMAPAKAFNLEEKPNPPINVDPILFYRIHNRDKEPMYAPIHKWGNDFTITRRLNGIFKRNFTTWSIFEISLRSIICMIIFGVIWPFNASWMLPVSIIIGLICHAIWYGSKFDGQSKTHYELMSHKFSEDGWNQVYKY